MSWAAYSGVMIATGLKFIAGPITGFSLGLTWYETVLFTWLGAMATVTIMYLLIHLVDTLHLHIHTNHILEEPC